MKNLSFLGQSLSKNELSSVMGGATCTLPCSCEGNTYVAYSNNTSGSDWAQICTSKCASVGKSWTGFSGDGGSTITCN